VTTAPLTILIAALGGEGGGVLMNWLVEAARRAGFAVQATSVPGVAQRTGSTSYYLEMLPQPALGQPSPVFALVPMPGRVDIVLASELVEAGRMMERGFVAPTRTTLIASTSRTYTTAEKIHGGDGRFDPAKAMAAADALAKRFVAHDLEALAREHGTLVSATLFGALAASGALPWPRRVSEAVLGDGRSAAASRAGFAAAFDLVASPAPAGVVVPKVPLGPVAQPGPGSPSLPMTSDARILALPAAVRDVARHGFDRTVDFQDAAYGALYLERVGRLAAAAAPAGQATATALVEAARRLALWMAYEDVPRVAELKIRPERFARIRRESEMTPGQTLHVIDYLKPGTDEIAAMLPKAWGERLMQRLARGKSLPLTGRGIHLKSTGIIGHMLLRGLAAFKHSRRGSLRYAQENTAIEAWLGVMTQALGRDPAFAGALAELPRVLKGYAETHARGRANYRAIFETLVKPALTEGTEVATAAPLAKVIAAALAEPEKFRV
jgi:indolepyruvate ferredoxin oxidoreductase, beta subunit